jgi:hypothetical protein
MSGDHFDPSSANAMFATILQRLKQQDEAATLARAEQKTTLEEIKVQTTKTNGRVSSLERWREGITAKISAIVFVATVVAWLIERLFR